MTGSAEDWIKQLDMSPASVGGWFAPALVSNDDIAGSALPPRFGVDHALYSANWYLLQAGRFSSCTPSSRTNCGSSMLS